MPKQPKPNHPNTPSTPPTGSRREELAAQNARDARDRRIRRRVGLILTLTAMAVLVFAGIWIAATAPPRPAPTTATTPGSTASGQDTFTVGVGRPDAPVRVDVYQDFMCPYCQRFEQANGPALEQLVDAGIIRLEIHPMSFLDRASQGPLLHAGSERFRHRRPGRPRPCPRVQPGAVRQPARRGHHRSHGLPARHTRPRGRRRPVGDRHIRAAGSRTVGR